MVKCYLHLSIFTVFLKNRNFISKIRIQKVTDYAALKGGCRGSSKSTLVKISNCWKSHVAAQLSEQEKG